MFIGKILTCTILGAAFLAGAAEANADQYVSGYTRHDGTYVHPYYRSSPDSSTFNNYSTRGNTNPYTGERGYAAPYGSSSDGFGNSGSFGSSSRSW
jgi:hypothetical protein